MIRIESASFTYRGADLRGTWHRPEHTGAQPVVIAAPGFGAVREMALPTLAGQLAAAGIAVLTFDYAGFGDSEGAPRQHVDPAAQVEQYGAAITHASSTPGIDAARIGLCGPSLAGGHALRLAATDERVRCAVAIAPFVEQSADAAPSDLVAAVVTDAAARARGAPPAHIPIVGRPGELAVLTADGAFEWVASQTAGLDVDNRVTVASLIEIANYRPLDALEGFAAPVRVIIGTDDSVNPPDLSRVALTRFENVDTVEVPATHFSIFDEHLDATNALTVEWFTQHLSTNQENP